MPTYKYEALDTSGNEVKDSIEATNEEEASAKIKSMGYFVTKLTATASGECGRQKEEEKDGQKPQDVHHRPRQVEDARDVHPAILHASGRRPARAPLAPHPRTADEAIGPEKQPDRCGGRRGIRLVALRGHGQAAQELSTNST